MGARFSILLPTHARADVLGLAIRSALVQTEPDFELLVVCDGCDEATREVLRSFDDDRLRVFDLPKAPGFGWANRNTVLRQAVGDLIANLADDDLWLPDHLERLMDAFEDEQVEWAYSRPLWMTDDGVAVPAAVDLRRPDHLASFMEVGNSIPAPCIVHRRSALERYGYWPDHLWRGEPLSAIDWELWRNMLRPSGGRNLAYVPEPTAIHFRASWRDADRWGLPVWSEWAAERKDGTTWWPDELTVDMTKAATPQEAAWRALEADPSAGPDASGRGRGSSSTAGPGRPSVSVSISPRPPARCTGWSRRSNGCGGRSRDGRSAYATWRTRSDVRLLAGTR